MNTPLKAAALRGMEEMAEQYRDGSDLSVATQA
jgi:hypothetical protein